MPRNEVLVDGVRLTREQIERAQRELDAPETFKRGDRVVRISDTSAKEFVVLGETDAEAVRKGYGFISETDQVLVMLETGCIYNIPPERLRRAA